jgi:acyl dehydratase
VTIPAAITAQVSALDDAIAAGGNLNTAPFSVINALAYQAGQLASAAQDGVGAAAGALDSFVAPVMPGDIITGFTGLLDAAQTQQSLAELESYAARIEINLENR